MLTSIEYSEKAIGIDQDYALAYAGIADAYVTLAGWLFLPSKQAFPKARELDPLSPVLFVAEASAYYYARQYDKTLELCQKALEIDPNFMGAHLFSANAQAQKQNYDEYFLGTIRGHMLGDTDPRQIDIWKNIYEVYKTSGIEGAARFAITLFEKASEHENIPPYWIVLPYAFLKNKEKLMDALDLCYEERTWPIHLLKVIPDLDFIRSEPRFEALLKKVGLDN